MIFVDVLTQAALKADSLSCGTWKKLWNSFSRGEVSKKLHGILLFRLILRLLINLFFELCSLGFKRCGLRVKLPVELRASIVLM